MQIGPATVPTRQVYFAITIGTTMMTAVTWLPSMLGAVFVGYGLDAAAISHLAAAETLGFLFGTLFTNARSAQALRPWVFAGCILLAGANLWVALHNSSAPSPITRGIAGIGAGLGFGYGLKTCATSGKPTLYFGLYTSSMSVLTVVGFQLAAHLMGVPAVAQNTAGIGIARDAVCSLAMIYSGAAVFAALLHFISRQKLACSLQPQRSREIKPPPPLAFVGLLAIALAFTAQGGLWVFLQILGISHGFSIARVANGMSVFALAGIAGSLTASITPLQWRRSTVGAVALALLWIGLYFVFKPSSVALYISGCAICGFYWSYLLPLLLGLLARIDISGRASVLGGTMSSGGATLGPLAAALLVHNANYDLVGGMAALLCLVSWSCIAFIEHYPAQNEAQRVALTPP